MIASNLKKSSTDCFINFIHEFQTFRDSLQTSLIAYDCPLSSIHASDLDDFEKFSNTLSVQARSQIDSQTIKSAFSEVIEQSSVEEPESVNLKILDDHITDSKDNQFTGAESHEEMEETPSEASYDDNKKDKDRPWTTEDDDLLLNLGTRYKNDWKKISKRILSLLGTRKTPTFLKLRYKEIKDKSSEIKAKFSHQEDLMLAAGIKKHGLNWMKIAESFPGRGAIMLKNRYYSNIRKKNSLDSLMEEVKSYEERGIVLFTDTKNISTPTTNLNEHNSMESTESKTEKIAYQEEVYGGFVNDYPNMQAYPQLNQYNNEVPPFAKSAEVYPTYSYLNWNNVNKTWFGNLAEEEFELRQF